MHGAFPGKLRLLRWALVPALAIGLGLLAIPCSGRSRTTSDLWADAMERFGPANFEKNSAVALYQLGRLREAGEWMRHSLDRGPDNLDVPPGLLCLATAKPASLHRQ